MKWKVATVVLFIAFIGFFVWAVAEVQKKKGALDTKKTEVENLKTDKIQLQKTVDAAKKEVEQRKKEMEDGKKEFAKKENDLNLREKAAQDEIKSLQEKVNSLTSLGVDKDKKVAELQQTQQSLQGDVTKERASKEAALKETEQLKVKNKTLTDKVSELEEKIKELESAKEGEKPEEKTPE